MKQETGLILGIPVDNLTFDQAIESIFELIKRFDRDHQAKYVATVNVDFIVNTVSWLPNRFRHPELVTILRKADLVTADGMPVVWAARLLGTRLKERVTGADLVPGLAKACALRGKSIYLLGGQGDVAWKTAEIFQKQYPDLHIAGISSPFVHVEGEKIIDEEAVDQQILADINQARPDILFVGFGNPKQEMWFERNRSKLKAAVTIGIGGTFEFITGRVKRAPVWIQKSGLEWIYRITQDPMRLFKRYFIGFFKFGILILPPILYLKYRKLFFNLKIKQATRASAPLSPETHKETSACLAVDVIVLDDPLDANQITTRGETLLQSIDGNNSLLMDLSQVSFIDSSGIGFLVKLYTRFQKEKFQLAFCGIQPPVLRTLKVSRILDLFKGALFDTREEAMTSLLDHGGHKDFSYFKDETEKMIILHLFGQLDADKISKMDIPGFTQGLDGKHCLLNLRGLSFADSSAIMLFLKVRKLTFQRGKSCFLCEPPDNVKQMLKITRVDKLFDIHKGLASALEILNQENS
jgi:N-acetylglucosaminyldiphosphoundecaprenol N-acetyl-beta-D-mannosaminyltransferase